MAQTRVLLGRVGGGGGGGGLLPPEVQSITLPNLGANAWHDLGLLHAELTDERPVWFNMMRPAGANLINLTMAFELGNLPPRFHKEIYINFKQSGPVHWRRNTQHSADWRGPGLSDFVMFYSNGDDLRPVFRFADVTETVMRSNMLGSFIEPYRGYLIRDTERRKPYGARSLARPAPNTSQSVREERKFVMHEQNKDGSYDRLPQERGRTNMTLRRIEWARSKSGLSPAGGIIRFVIDGFSVQGTSHGLVESSFFTYSEASDRFT